MNTLNNNMMGNNMNGLNQPNYFPNMNMNMNMNVNNFPRYNIIKVSGKNGADAFQMAPNSQVLLLDENDPLIWFVQTDGAGYKTISPYTITPYQPSPQIDLNTIEQRLTALEEKINAKSYSGTNKQRKSNTRYEQQQQQSNEFTNATD